MSVLTDLSSFYDSPIEDNNGSPDYRPTSPVLPDGTLGFPSLISDNNVDVNTSFDPSLIGKFDPPKRRKRKSTKQKAEDQFDATAAPITLKVFFDNTVDEVENLEIDLMNDKKLNTENECLTENKVLAEECAIASLVVAQNNAPNSEQCKKLIMTADFPDEIANQYLVAINENPEDHDLTKEIVKIKDLKYNKKLFYERRLIQSLQFRRISSPEFIERHFPFDEKLLNLDIRSIYNDDHNSWNIIRSRLQTICQESTSLESLFYGKDWKKKFRDMLNWKHSDKYKMVAICTYFTFFSEKRDVDRSVKLADAEYDLFGNSKFREFTISEIFSMLGFNFITEYCAFQFYRDRIINQFELTHHDIMIDLKKDIRKRKKLKSRLGPKTIFDVYEKFEN